MLTKALLVTLSYYLAWMLDSIFSNQTFTRPIVLGAITGLLCGDVKTGVIMGASLEAVYMGISGIGGVTAADYRSATAIGVGLVICSGITIEEGIALAATAGALLVSFMQVTVAVSNVMEPVYMRLAKEGNVKKYNLVMWLHMFLLQHLLDTLVVFVVVYLGSGVVDKLMAVIPSWVINGLSVSGGMLVVVGLCLTAQALSSKALPFFILLGFVLSKYLNLPIMAIAMIGVVISYVLFSQNKKINDAKKANATVVKDNEEDDFYA